MAPCPDQVHEHHHVAAGFVGEEMEAEIAVERQHRERRGEDREGGDDQQVRGKRGPAEHRHAQIAHAGRAHLQDRGDEIDARHQRADAGYLQRPDVVVDADAGRILSSDERRIGQPAGPRELADDERDVDEQRAGGGQPEADRIQRRKGDVAHAELQRHHEVHQPDHERHRDEEDHDRAVSREDLVVMFGRQIAGRLEGDRLLRAHHDRVDEAAQQHHQREHVVHHADPLVIDARDPLAPEIRTDACEVDPREHGDNHRSRSPMRPAGSADRTELPPSSVCPAFSPRPRRRLGAELPSADRAPAQLLGRD